MNHKTIKALQKKHYFDNIQANINNGMAWKLEGSVGRFAMRFLESGACMLPTKSFNDSYGNVVPSRKNLKKGTKGTYHNSINFWTKVENGEIDLYE